MKVLNTSNTIIILEALSTYEGACWVSLTAILALILGEFAMNRGNNYAVNRIDFDLTRCLV